MNIIIFIKVTGYPPYEIAQDKDKVLKKTNNAKSVNTPPASSYGVPYDKVFFI